MSPVSQCPRGLLQSARGVTQTGKRGLVPQIRRSSRHGVPRAACGEPQGGQEPRARAGAWLRALTGVSVRKGGRQGPHTENACDRMT